MRLVYLLSELLQECYSMPARLKGERILHMHECLHEYLHSFQHYAAHRKIHTQHGVGENLIIKEVIDHDSFKEQKEIVEIPSLREFEPSKLLIEFVNFNKFRGTSDNSSASIWIFFNIITLLCTVVPYDNSKIL